VWLSESASIQLRQIGVCQSNSMWVSQLAAFTSGGPRPTAA
jgi:hypothetical protein